MRGLVPRIRAFSCSGRVGRAISAFRRVLTRYKRVYARLDALWARARNSARATKKEKTPRPRVTGPLVLLFDAWARRTHQRRPWLHREFPSCDRRMQRFPARPMYRRRSRRNAEHSCDDGPRCLCDGPVLDRRSAGAGPRRDVARALWTPGLQGRYRARSGRAIPGRRGLADPDRRSVANLHRPRTKVEGSFFAGSRALLSKFRIATTFTVGAGFVRSLKEREPLKCPNPAKMVSWPALHLPNSKPGSRRAFFDRLQRTGRTERQRECRKFAPVADKISKFVFAQGVVARAPRLAALLAARRRCRHLQHTAAAVVTAGRG